MNGLIDVILPAKFIVWAKPPEMKFSLDGSSIVEKKFSMREARTGKKFRLKFKQGTPPCFFISFLGRAPTVHLGAIFIIRPAPAFCQEEISTKINEKIFPQLCILTIVFYSWMWYYNNVKREEKRLIVLFFIPVTLLPSGNTQASNGCTQLGKTFSKKFEKPSWQPLFFMV